jgi:hypothetical protein
VIAITKVKVIGLTLLIALLMITYSQAAISTQTSFASSGMILYKSSTYVDFETTDSYKWGVDGANDYLLYGVYYSGTPPYWSRGSYPAYTNPGTLFFEPTNTIVYRGAKSANLTVADTSAESTRRMEILHDWDPQTEYVMLSGWYYFPYDLNPSDAWVTFHRAIYERMWDQEKAVYYQYFQISVSLLTDGRSATNGQQIFVLSLGKGNIDNNNDGVTEEWPYLGADLYSNTGSNKDVPSTWLTKKTGLQVPFGEWFKVTTLIYRNLNDFNDGYVKVWINDDLVWDIDGVRTVGIAPTVLEDIDPTPPEPQGYVCSGFGLYTDMYSKPKTIFVDDIMYSNSTSY